MQITYEYVIDDDASVIKLKRIMKMVGIGYNEKQKAKKTQKDE